MAQVAEQLPSPRPTVEVIADPVDYGIGLPSELASFGRLNNALIELLPLHSDDVHVETVQDWSRTGTETFSKSVDVNTPAGQIPLIEKAWIAGVPGRSLTESTRELLRRRELLTAQGDFTPTLYGYDDKATILEQRMDTKLTEALTNADEQGRRRLLAQTAALMTALGRAGFTPGEVFDDFMVSGDKVALVDFGSDLGEPGSPSAMDGVITSRRLLAYWQRQSVRLSNEDQQFFENLNRPAAA